MNRLIIDTDLLSEILKAKNAKVLDSARNYSRTHQHFTFTSITVFEILFGLMGIKSETQVKSAEEVFAKNEEIVPNAEDYRLSAGICATLRSKGTPIGIVDPLIAACAINRGLGVATGNIRHFQYIRDAGFEFHCENWRDAERSETEDPI